MTVAKPLADAALEKYYQDLFVLYGSPGWQVMMDDLTNLKEVYNSVGPLETLEDLWFRKGQLELIDQLLTHQGRHEQAYADAVDAEQGDGAAEQPTGGKATLEDIT